MIAGYEVANNTVASPGAGVAALELRAPTRRFKIREFSVASQAATAFRFGLGRPAAIGVTPVTQSTVQAQDPAEVAGTTISVISWTTGPTVPGTQLRQFDFNNVPGSAVIWTWPSDGELIDPIVAGAATTLVLWAITAGPTCDYYAVGGE